jgi:hypothetical protein
VKWTPEQETRHRAEIMRTIFSAVTIFLQLCTLTVQLVILTRQ